RKVAGFGRIAVCDVQVNYLYPPPFRFLPRMFLAALLQTLGLQVYTGILRVHVAKNIDLAECVFELPARFALASLPGNRIHQVPALSNSTQRLLKLRLFR